MGRAPDKDTSDTAPPQNDDGRPGHVEVDSRGNSVWRWARDVLDSTSHLLKRLENKDLALEPTQKVPVMRGVAHDKAKPNSNVKGEQGAQKPSRRRDLDIEDAPRDSGGGFDPYNSR